MKKIIFILMATFMMVASANAQYEGNKITDNVSVGLSAGVYTPMQGHSFFGDLAPQVAIQGTKYFNPVFGVGLEAQMYVNPKGSYHSCAFPYLTNLSALGYVNVSNLVWGYKGAPRTVEVEALYGLGWGHIWGDASYLVHDGTFAHNFMTSKADVNINWNLGAAKQWTLSLKPAVVWNLDGYRGDISHNTHYSATDAAVELSAGVTYHFTGSNGKAYMTYAKLYDQAEVDALNAQINALRAQEPQVKEVEKIVEKKVPFVIDATYVVTFAQNSAELSDAAKATLDKVPTKVQAAVLATASPEGTPEYNQALSEKRANAVADYLKGRGIEVSKVEAIGESLGETSNRLAIVTVAKSEKAKFNKPEGQRPEKDGQRPGKGGQRPEKK